MVIAMLFPIDLPTTLTSKKLYWSQWMTMDSHLWYAGKCLTTDSPGGIKSRFAAFASFHGVNPPTTSDFKLNDFTEHRVGKR